MKCRIFYLVFSLCFILSNSIWADTWSMKGHDTRGTGQSNVSGPRTANSPNNWVYVAEGAVNINMGATITSDTVYFGTWGLMRKSSSSDCRSWDKSDGKFYGLNLKTGKEKWPPLHPGITHFCYEYKGRKQLPRDKKFVKSQKYIASFYNGTIEGQPAVDPVDGTIYFGRGDGRLYAVNPQTGKIKWTFTTFNPEIPDDPDGGGEIIAGPIIGQERTIYFGTVAAPLADKPPMNPRYETNAFYAVSHLGKLKWRFPSNDSLENCIMSSAVISKDNSTLYFGTFGSNPKVPGEIYAINLNVLDNSSDDARLKWKLSLKNKNRNIYVTSLSYGLDDTLYVGGYEIKPGGSIPVVIALKDLGSKPQFQWPQKFIYPEDEQKEKAQFVGGLALREVESEVKTLYVSTANTRMSNKKVGRLYAIEPKTGKIRAVFDPNLQDPPAFGGLNSPAIDKDGVIYVGVRGTEPLFGKQNRIPGRLFAIVDKENSLEKLWDFSVAGSIDWAHPAIGPDGGIYFGSATGYPFYKMHRVNDIPPKSSPKFYAIKKE